MQGQFCHTLTIKDSIASSVLYLESKTMQNQVNQNVNFVSSIKVEQSCKLFHQKRHFNVLKNLVDKVLERWRESGLIDLFPIKVAWSEIWIRKV